VTGLEDGSIREYALNGGDWVVFEGATLSVPGPDGEKSVIVRQTDGAGNISDSSAPLGFMLDTEAPEIGITSLADITKDGELTAADLLDGDNTALEFITLEGTIDAPDDTTITVSFGSDTLTTSASGGVWSLDIPASTVTAQLGGLDSITIEASATDGAGNTGTGTLPLAIDLRVPSISIVAPENNFEFGLHEFEQGAIISGTSENVAEGQTVTITIKDGPDDTEGFEGTTNVGADGSWSLSITPEQVQHFQDQTPYNLAVSVTDPSYPIPATRSIDITTDIPPEISFDPIGDDGALILADIAASGEFTFSGTTRGVQKDQQVTLFVRNGDDVKNPLFDDPAQNPTVDANGNWTVTFAPDISGIDPGTEFVFSAEVSNASGTSAETSETVVAYQQSGLYIDLNEFGSLSTFNVFVETERLADPFLFVAEFSISFDPSLGSFDFEGLTIPMAVTNTALQSNRFNISDLGGTATVGSTGEFSYALGSLRGFDNLSIEPMVGFGLSGIDTSSVITFSISDAISQNFIQSGDALADTAPPPGSTEPVGVNTTDAHFGPSVTIIGTNGRDTLTAANIDTVIRGRGGDDLIDVSAPGVNTIIFEAGSNDNGFDTITGFTLGGALADRFAIAFDTFNQNVLRGSGEEFQVTSGGDVGADVGLLVFTTAVADFENATIEAALSNLTGLNNGDSLFVLIGDGTDAVLTAFDMGNSGVSVGTSSGKSYAEFKGIGDLSGFSSANIVGFEQYNT